MTNLNTNQLTNVDRLIELHRQLKEKGLTIKEMREYDNLTRTSLDSLIDNYLYAIANRSLVNADWKADGN